MRPSGPRAPPHAGGRALEPRAQPSQGPRSHPCSGPQLRVAHSPVADHHALDGLHGRGPGGRGRDPSCGEMPAPQRPRTRAERQAERPETAERRREPGAETAERGRRGARVFPGNARGAEAGAHPPACPPAPLWLDTGLRARGFPEAPVISARGSAGDSHPPAHAWGGLCARGSF